MSRDDTADSVSQCHAFGTREPRAESTQKQETLATASVPVTTSEQSRLLSAMLPPTDKPVEVFWICIRNIWSLCVVHVKGWPIHELCQYWAETLFRHFVPSAPAMLETEDHDISLALADARRMHQDDRIADFFMIAQLDQVVFPMMAKVSRLHCQCAALIASRWGVCRASSQVRVFR